MNKFGIAATLLFAVLCVHAVAQTSDKIPFTDLSFFGGAISVADTPDKVGVFHFDGKTLFFNRTGKRKETVFMGNAAAEPPRNKRSPVGWAEVTINGMAYKIPLYQ